MRRIALAILCLCVASAVAQGAEPSQPAQYTLTLSPADISELGAALSERPYHEVAALIGKLQEQIAPQNNKAVVPPAQRLPSPPAGGADAPKH